MCADVSPQHHRAWKTMVSMEIFHNTVLPTSWHGSRYSSFGYCLVLGYPTVTPKGAANRSSIKGFAALFFVQAKR
jgi:hypothetical protein